MKTKLLGAVAALALMIASDAANSSGIFIYSGGVYTEILPDPPNTGNTGSGINNVGQIVGYGSFNGLGGFIYNYNTKVSTALSDPFASPNETLPTGINDSGQVVGRYFNAAVPNGGPHGFLYYGGTFTPIEVPGPFAVSPSTMPVGISNTGLIAGYFQGTDNEQHGFLYSGGSYSTLDFPGSFNTVLIGINNLDQVLGAFASHGPSGNFGGQFLYDVGTGVFTTINPPTLRRGH